MNIQTIKTLKGDGRVFRHFFGNPFGKESPFGGQTLLKSSSAAGEGTVHPRISGKRALARVHCRRGRLYRDK